MVALPVTMPTFTSNESNLAHLQQLKYGVEFLIDDQVKPTWHFYKTATFSCTASTWVSPLYATAAFDSDSTQVSGGAVIATQGIYAVEGCTQVLSGSTAGFLYKAAFLLTAGANNPNLTAASTLRFGQRGGETASSTTAASSAICCADSTPFALYPGDRVDLQVFCGTTITLQNNINTNYIEGRFAANFTGQWIRNGT